VSQLVHNNHSIVTWEEKTMNKNLLLKVGASLLAVFLMTACNNPDDAEQEEMNTEETDTEETNTEETNTEETDTEEGTETEEAETEETAE
jgi:hypothetical protein